MESWRPEYGTDDALPKRQHGFVGVDVIGTVPFAPGRRLRHRTSYWMLILPSQALETVSAECLWMTLPCFELPSAAFIGSMEKIWTVLGRRVAAETGGLRDWFRLPTGVGRGCLDFASRAQRGYSAAKIISQAQPEDCCELILGMWHFCPPDS